MKRKKAIPSSRGNFYYPHLPLNVRIYKHTFDVPVEVNKDKFKLEEKSSVANKRIVGIWVANPGGKGLEGADIVPETIFNASYLNLQEEQTLVSKMIPLRQIAQANANGHPYYIDMATVHMVESTIEITDQEALPRAEDNYVFQFTLEFTKLEKEQ